MRKDALLLKPGQAVTGSFTFDSKVFADSLKPGAYRLEAVLYGWNLLFDNSQLSGRLAGRWGAPFLIGESTASSRVELRGGGMMTSIVGAFGGRRQNNAYAAQRKPNSPKSHVSMRRSLSVNGWICVDSFIPSLSIALVHCVGCDACCSPPGFYSVTLLREP